MDRLESMKKKHSIPVLSSRFTESFTGTMAKGVLRTLLNIKGETFFRKSFVADNG